MEALGGADIPGIVVPPAAGDEVECGPAVEARVVVRDVPAPSPDVTVPSPTLAVSSVIPPTVVDGIPAGCSNPDGSPADAASRPTTMVGSRSAAASPPVN